jgi:hypothetical protein
MTIPETLMPPHSQVNDNNKEPAKSLGMLLLWVLGDAAKPGGLYCDASPSLKQARVRSFRALKTFWALPSPCPGHQREHATGSA